MICTMGECSSLAIVLISCYMEQVKNKANLRKESQRDQVHPWNRNRCISRVERRLSQSGI